MINLGARDLVGHMSNEKNVVVRARARESRSNSLKIRRKKRYNLIVEEIIGQEKRNPRARGSTATG